MEELAPWVLQFGAMGILVWVLKEAGGLATMLTQRVATTFDKMETTLSAIGESLVEMKREFAEHMKSDEFLQNEISERLERLENELSSVSK